MASHSRRHLHSHRRENLRFVWKLLTRYDPVVLMFVGKLKTPSNTCMSLLILKVPNNGLSYVEVKHYRMGGQTRQN